MADLPTDRDALVERLCERMHRAYEDAAVVEGWATQEASRKPWADVPAANQRTMRASVTAALALLEAEGWGPCASRCRHHDGYCSDIVGANEDLGEALVTARAEVKRLEAENAEQLTEIERHLSAYGRQAELLDRMRAERDAAPRQTLRAFADRLAGEIIPTQDGCVQFAVDVAEEYPGGAYSGEASWREENARLMGLLRDIAVARRGGTSVECDRDHEDLPDEIRSDHEHAARLAEEIEVLRRALGLQPGEQICGARPRSALVTGTPSGVCLLPARHVDGGCWHRNLGGTWSL